MLEIYGVDEIPLAAALWYKLRKTAFGKSGNLVQRMSPIALKYQVETPCKPVQPSRTSSQGSTRVTSPSFLHNALKQ